MADDRLPEKVLDLLEKHMIRQTETGTKTVQTLESIDRRFGEVLAKYDDFSKTMGRIDNYMKTIITILIAFGVSALVLLVT